MIRKHLNFLFNWKENPASVVFLAIPLALIGLGSVVMLAVLQWAYNGDPVYAGILLAGFVLLGIGLIPAYRMHKALNGRKPQKS